MAERSLFAAGFVIRLITVVILGFPIYRRGMIGAGDVKMAALFTAWLGVQDGLKALTIGFMLGAVLALLKMLRQGSMVKRFLYLSAYIRHSFQSRMMEIYYDPQGTEERRSSRWEPAFLWEQPRQRYGERL